MPNEALVTKLKRNRAITLLLMMLVGFCLLVITGLFVPKVLALLDAIDTSGVSGMRWPHFLILASTGLYGIIGFGLYIAFKVLEKAVVDDILTSLPSSEKESQ